MSESILNEIYERSRGRALTAAMLRGLMKQFFVEAESLGRDLRPALAKLDEIVDVLPVRDTTVKALRDNMTDDEIEKMAALYRSTLGARFAEFGVVSAEPVASLVQQWATQKVILPAFGAAGIDQEAAEAMGMNAGQPWQPATWEGVAPEARDVSRALVHSIGFAARVDEMVKTQAEALTGQGLAAVEPSAEDKQGLLDRTAEVYAKFFTLDELRELHAFYATPFGQRFVALTPLLGQAGQTAIEAWTTANPGQLEQRVAQVIELLQ